MTGKIKLQVNPKCSVLSRVLLLLLLLPHTQAALLLKRSQPIAPRGDSVRHHMVDMVDRPLPVTMAALMLKNMLRFASQFTTRMRTALRRPGSSIHGPHKRRTIHLRPVHMFSPRLCSMLLRVTWVITNMKKPTWSSRV